MTSHRKQIYEPSKSAGEYDPLDDSDEDLASHPLPRFIVLALLSLAGLATAVWFGYEHGVDRGSGEMVVIGPPPGPVRTRPEQPGGTAAPYQGLKVYEQPKTAEAEAESSRLSPVSSSETALASANPTNGAPAEAQPEPAASRPDNPQPAEYLQIGAYPTPDLAQKAFREFRIAHRDLAGDLLPDIKKADLGVKGIWYRLRIGPFEGKAAATETCDKMKKQGVTCLIGAR
jgi:hypothetical protein